MKRITGILGIGIVAVLAVTACSGTLSPTTAPGGALHPKVDEAQATQIAKAALGGFNSGDYGTWTTGWSATMKSAIGPDAFAQFRQTTIASSGTFVSIDRVELSPAKTSGFVKYSFATTFSKARMTYSIVLAENGDQVEGVRLDPAS